MEVNSGENDHSMRVAGQEEEDDDELLERRILGHPLYLLLVETHINCVKVGLGEIRDVDRAIGKKQVKFKHGTPNYPGTSELDLFMVS
ncbi:hypothetical protein GH714_002361 [Hevea brasiliensis]|uniref:KNOX1 domain-containing protein n=1 Tax=Hevea brasiliensis TaxID=3981 RepID=A0A6A6MKT7_HEVBR|nr:hypothetical protein GH714_002361 [Hevea brasiliensis]